MYLLFLDESGKPSDRTFAVVSETYSWMPGYFSK